MASKQKRSSSRVTRDSILHVDTSSQPDESVNSSSQYSPTSGGSTRWSRQQEKQQLSHLNDRLATYIERVRNLESENARLHVQVRDVEIVERKQKDDLEERYNDKIAKLNKDLDCSTRENARLEIEKAKAVDAHADLKARVNDLDKKLKKAENDYKNAFNNVQDLTARLNNADNARNIAEKENAALKKELDTLQNQLDVLHKQLEDEVVLRTELEHKLKTCKDDLEFARRNHSTQMEEFRRKRQIEMTSFSTEVESRYNAQLQEQLQSMRDNFDQRIAQNRAEMDEMFRTKLAESEGNAARNRATAADAREEASRYRMTINELETKLSGHDERVRSLSAQIKDLEQLLRRQQDEYGARIQQRDDRIQALEADAAKMLIEYQDLMDLKLQLNTELEAYQKLLEGEENRLHITPTASPNASQLHVSFDDSANGSRRGIKRKRINEESYVDFSQKSKTYKCNSDTVGDISVEHVDPEGLSITLHNNGSQDIPVGGWFVKSTGGNDLESRLEVTFKFHSRQILKAGKSITIWSNNAGKEANPPTDLVMKNQTWPTGDAIRAELISPEEEVHAWRECVYEQGFYRSENGTDPSERCSLM